MSGGSKSEVRIQNEEVLSEGNKIVTSAFLPLHSDFVQNPIML
jgi:hypothetical protein